LEQAYLKISRQVLCRLAVQNDDICAVEACPIAVSNILVPIFTGQGDITTSIAELFSHCRECNALSIAVLNLSRSTGCHSTVATIIGKQGAIKLNVTLAIGHLIVQLSDG